MTKTAKARRKSAHPAHAAKKAGINSIRAHAGAAKTMPATESKLGVLLALLRHKSGASLAQMTKATGWQAHSVRGAISGAIKKKLGLTVATEQKNGVRLYRVVS